MSITLLGKQEGDTFVSDSWSVRGYAPAALNGAEEVHALVLHHAYEGVLPNGHSLGLVTLLSVQPIDAELLETAFGDFNRPCTAAVRDAHMATSVTIDGVAQSEARLASMSPQLREAVNLARHSQVMRALQACLDETWVGGVLFLRPFAAPFCSAELLTSLSAFAESVLLERDGPPSPEQSEVDPIALPSLPVAVCGGCHEPLEAGGACCSRCLSVVYHGKECQKAHWRAGHKNECKPVKLPKVGGIHLFDHVPTAEERAAVFADEQPGLRP